MNEKAVKAVPVDTIGDQFREMYDKLQDARWRAYEAQREEREHTRLLTEFALKHGYTGCLTLNVNRLKKIMDSDGKIR